MQEGVADGLNVAAMSIAWLHDIGAADAAGMVTRLPTVTVAAASTAIANLLILFIPSLPAPVRLTPATAAAWINRWGRKSERASERETPSAVVPHRPPVGARQGARGDAELANTRPPRRTSWKSTVSHWRWCGPVHRAMLWNWSWLIPMVGSSVGRARTELAAQWRQATLANGLNEVLAQ